MEYLRCSQNIVNISPMAQSDLQALYAAVDPIDQPSAIGSRQAGAKPAA
jgi:hypothetical protein